MHLGAMLDGGVACGWRCGLLSRPEGQRLVGPEAGGENLWPSLLSSSLSSGRESPACLPSTQFPSSGLVLVRQSFCGLKT